MLQILITMLQEKKRREEENRWVLTSSDSSSVEHSTTARGCLGFVSRRRCYKKEKKLINLIELLIFPLTTNIIILSICHINVII